MLYNVASMSTFVFFLVEPYLCDSLVVFSSPFFFLVVVLAVVVAVDFTMMLELESSDELELLSSVVVAFSSDKLFSGGGVRNEVIILT